MTGYTARAGRLWKPEEWRDIRGFEGIYQASDRGRVRSLDRIVKRSDGVCQRRSGGPVTPWLDNGYQRVELRGRSFKVSRLVAAAFLGLTDCGIVDHIDCNRGNDSVDNLRCCSYSENKCNAVVRADSLCGVKGIQRRDGRFRARIQVNGKRIHLGWFNSMEAAAAAYQQSAIKHHGEFARF